MPKKKILFVTNQLPYPPSTGGKVKSWFLLKNLSQHYDIGLVTLLKKGEKQHEQEMLQNLSLSDYYSEFLDINRNVWNLVKSYFLSETLNVYRNRSERFYEKVKKLKAAYDCVLADHYDIFPAIIDENKTKIIFHEHNAEYKIWERLAELEKNLLKRMVIRKEANRIKKAELKFSNKAALIWAAPNDIESLEAIGVSSKKLRETYHLANDQYIKLADIAFEKTEKRVLFVGTQSWEANIDGMEWFLKEVWPIVRKKEKDAKLFVIGKNPNPRLTRLAGEKNKVFFTGFVNDLEEYYATSRVSIIPLRFGSGMKVKLLSAMYRGIPCVSTPVGAEGIEIVHNEHAFIQEKAEDFGNSVIELLNNEEKWTKFRNNSRSLAKAKYTWKSLITKHAKEIDELINGQ